MICGWWKREQLKRKLKKYYSKVFAEASWCIPVLDGIEFQQLNTTQNSELTMPFTLEELEDAVWSCDGNKAPGPDGFNFSFIKKKVGDL